MKRDTLYCTERKQAADENILNSTRATDFITPKSEISTLFRNAVLYLAARVPFGRALVNSGRLSVPCVDDGSSLNGPDHPLMPARTRPGAPLADGWLLNRLGGGFQMLAFDANAPEIQMEHGVTVPRVALSDTDNPALRERYLGIAAAVYLLRPDQHVAARWDHFDAKAVTEALAHALALM